MMAELSTTSLTPTEFLLDKTSYNQTGCSSDTAPSVSIYSIILLICAFGLVGNSIVLWFVGFIIKRNPFTVYILNLAVTDACFLLFSVIFIIAYVMAHSFCVVTYSWIRIIFCLLALLMYNNSLYLLTAISSERCLSVLYPIWYRCRRPRHLSAIVCAVLWVLSILLSGTIVSFCIFSDFEIYENSFLSMGILNVVIIIPIMVLSNLTLFIKVRCSSQRRQPGKLYTVILLTVLFFLLFAVPMSVKNFLSYEDICKLSNILYMLAAVNSSVNPFIYFLVGSYRKRRFRASVKDALQSIFEEKINPRKDGGTTEIDPVEKASKIPSPASQRDLVLGRGCSLGPRIKELSKEQTLQVPC